MERKNSQLCESRSGDIAEKRPEQGRYIDDFRPITLLKAEFKLLAEVLAKRLAKRLTHIVGDLAGESQTCTIPKRSFNGNLHFVRYIIEKWLKNLARVGLWSI